MTTPWERLDKDMVRAVMHRIRNGPEEFDMDTFGSFDDKAALCNTACCVAGEAILVDNLRRGMTPAVAVRGLVGMADVGGVSDRAAELLGLRPPVGPDDRVPLFYSFAWPVAYASERRTVKAQALDLLQDMIDGTVEFDRRIDSRWWKPFAVNRRATP